MVAERCVRGCWDCQLGAVTEGTNSRWLIANNWVVLVTPGRSLELLKQIEELLGELALRRPGKRHRLLFMAVSPPDPPRVPVAQLMLA